MHDKYDVIVIGAGHAGCEAAHAAATMGSKVLLVTMNMGSIGQMSCNPAMGGIAKGQIIREIDALGGMSGIVTDMSTIQFRMLNTSKGMAMWSPRSQNDRMLFANYWREILEKNINIDFWQEMCTELLIERKKVIGIKTSLGVSIYGKSVILTNGTFLNGLIHIGNKQFGGGRAGEKNSIGLTEQLLSLGFAVGRMKTGTPPRVDGRTLNYDMMQEQMGDQIPAQFSFTHKRKLKKQRSCYITYTNNKVHEILKQGFNESPMFNGRIKATGPRYCPSIEDKIDRFAERDRHQIFVEPEGWNTVEIYVNGFSTSLPEGIQYKALRSIVGFENAKMFRPGYAIEYDYFPPTQLKLTLETKNINNLYFAGQINGTTGYEEAACQGLIAGINAHLKNNEKDTFILKRSEAYIGVLIDDLINKGTEEPYRMFTSRAEFRLLLRQDNANLRLTKKGYELGLAKEKAYKKVIQIKNEVNTMYNYLNKVKIKPQECNELLEKKSSAPIKQKTPLINLLKRPKIYIEDIKKLNKSIYENIKKYDKDVQFQTDINIKYDSYIQKEKELANKINMLELKTINKDFNYDQINSLSTEAKEKLKKIKPLTIGQASRISGVSQSDLSLLLVYIN